MAKLRIEIAIIPYQLLTCESCGWASILRMGPICPKCGTRFDEVLLVLSDDNDDFLYRATSKLESTSIEM